MKITKKQFQQFEQVSKTNDSSISTHNQRILAIDPGYGRCGWAVLAKQEKPKTKNQKFNPSTSYKLQATSCLIACGLIETDKRKNLPERLSEIYKAIVHLIKKFNPTELAIESLFWFKNQKTAMNVSQARGAIIVCAKNHKLEVSEYTPLQVKQAVVGYGKATKDQIQKMIQLHLQNQKVSKQDDVADAIAVGLTHLQTNKY